MNAALSSLSDQSQYRNYVNALIGVFFILSLFACGGGGGSNTSSNADSTNWTLQAYVKPSNIEAFDAFGSSAAIDGDTAVVAAKFEDSGQTTISNNSTITDNNQALDSGAVYVLVRNGANWSQQAYLKAPNPDKDDYFGESIAISGDTIVVGAPFEDSRQTTITSSGSADNSANAKGAAYVYVRNGNTWDFQAFLKAPRVSVGDRFGGSVSIDNDTIVVGANGEDSNQTSISDSPLATSTYFEGDSGAAYVFVRNNSTWNLQAYLKPSNSKPNNKFGTSVAIHGETIVVGAPSESSGQKTITNGSSINTNSVTLSSGAAYVFVRANNSWSQQAYLKASNADVFDFFGSTVAISGDTVVVGAYGESSNQTTVSNGTMASANNSVGSSGAAYVFVRSDNNWSHQAYLKPSKVGLANQFSLSIAIKENIIAVGSPGEDASEQDSGAVDIFIRDTVSSNWSHTAQIKAPNAGREDKFGSGLALSNNTIVVGAINEDSSQNSISNVASDNNSALNAGAAYVFSLPQ